MEQEERVLSRVKGAKIQLWNRLLFQGWLAKNGQIGFEAIRKITEENGVARVTTTEIKRYKFLVADVSKNNKCVGKRRIWHFANDE